MSKLIKSPHIFAALVLALTTAGRTAGALAAPLGFLEGVHHYTTLTSTVTDNGDLNPYAVVVAPVSAGKIEKDDVLVDNFNNISNLQGTGGTIVGYRPTTKQTYTLAKIPQTLSQCPGGVGLTTAMTMLKSGWIIVGSTPSRDGTTATKGDGCLLVIDPTGKLVAAWSGPTINDPWGDMAVVDRGDRATLFVSMAGFGLPSPDVIDPKTKLPVVLHKATVLRLELRIPDGKPPELVSQTVVADGFAQRADRDNFLLGPTGLALGPDDTLYVTDGLENVITAIPQAVTRTDSAGVGKVVTQDGLLAWPLAMVWTPEGHLLVCNGKDGRVVEIDPAAGKQLYAKWINTDQAQSPPGNGDLFGLALTPDKTGFYYVMDDVNTLMKASR
jgi:sugar lactone lactonase YvrE